MKRRPYFAQSRPVSDDLDEIERRYYQRPTIRLINPKTGEKVTVVRGIGIEYALYEQGWQDISEGEQS